MNICGRGSVTRDRWGSIEIALTCITLVQYLYLCRAAWVSGVGREVQPIQSTTSNSAALALGGRVAMVTGASGGIGRVLARRYARAGASVALVARREAELEQTAQLVGGEGGESLQLVADIRDEEQCRDVVTRAVARFGRLDVLVNNAAIPGADQPISQADAANWQEVLATNLLAPVMLSREVLRQNMICRGSGNIQFLSSAAARSVRPGKGHYAASKLALSALCQTLALEVGAAGIRVNTLVIGAVAGELLDRYIARQAAQQQVEIDEACKRIAAGNALGRLVESGEVADVSVWLASDAASAITGQDIFVTGGQRL